MRQMELVIIGGGAAGMSAAVAASEQGCKDLMIIERNDSLGGVLHQCIHNGFGLHRFGEDLTGVEFAQRYEELVKEHQIPYMLNTFVIDISKDKVVTCVSPEEGLIKIQAQAIILAMGCRERSRNALLIPGTRGAGIMTAGTAQKYLNLMGYLPGKNVVILGSGDIGLIMARQFVMEGVKVSAVVEVMPYSGGLPRNMKQCIEDFDIPVYYSSTVSKICGRERVSSVWVSKVNENREPIEGTEFEIPCDTLMISAGLIPENELTEGAGIAMSPMTKGAIVYENNETSIPGIFSCGNVLHVHDLVDFVSEEGTETGKYAVEYIASAKDCKEGKTAETKKEDDIVVEKGPGAAAIVPQRIHRDTAMEKITFMFRPSFKKNDVTLLLSSGDKILTKKKMIAVTPGEMCKLTVPAEKLSEVETSLIISVCVNEKEA